MAAAPLRLDAATVGRVTHALATVPKAAYSVPHVYPSAAPAWTPAPFAERPTSMPAQLRLYVHVPFCRYHCTFCYFAVRAGADAATRRTYVDALVRELEWIVPGTPLSQLFVGGGTPTALEPELLDAVLATIADRTTALADPVHTVETSPETITAAHLDVLRARGVRRISMGIQSLDEEVLDAVHRRHGAEEALAACSLIVDAGFILNVDLIYGLPGQTEAMLLRDLHAIARRGVPAVTLYSLRSNERTAVSRALAADDRFDLAGLMRWRAFIEASTAELGYTQTRWHTFKRLDSIARAHHRLPCFDDEMVGYQLGVGASARSHLGHTVYRNHERIETYVDRITQGRSPVEQVFPLDEADRATQLIARTLGDGGVLARAVYERAFGRPIDADHGALIVGLRDAGLLDDDGERLALSTLGRLVYDVVMLAFYPPKARRWLAARESRASFVRPTSTAAAS
jgi:oxygen-independent coproporphyrinogen III oxidase